MLPLDESFPAGSGPLPDERSPASERALRVLEELLAGRKEQLLHDAWTVRAVFGSPTGPWRRAGFANRVLVRAATAEMDRSNGLWSDPLEEAFWLLAEQRLLLNHCVVEERAARVLFGEVNRLRPSQQRSVLRLLRLRSANHAHAEGDPASNLLLIAVAAGGLAAGRSTESMKAAIASRFPAKSDTDLPVAVPSRAEELLLPREARDRLDERALALDLSFRAGARLL